ncbi:hypothetical protein BDV33DRAFT_186377 [Aspergillus novoparasiticus]|uniref:Uncharacterized protein n=1 Tax=Aspergillus novoparasiticus TaxID=986946 RepID=A0A5N6E510_9EURO|nr:hypothetical protein BDV33DRAFT_186377 [Aspergillus novoparasiticus]
MAYPIHKRTRGGTKPNNPNITVPRPAMTRRSLHDTNCVHTQPVFTRTVLMREKQPKATLRLGQPKRPPNYYGSVWWTSTRASPDEQREKVEDKEAIRQSWLRRLRPRPSSTSTAQEQKPSKPRRARIFSK